MPRDAWANARRIVVVPAGVAPDSRPVRLAIDRIAALSRACVVAVPLAEPWQPAVIDTLREGAFDAAIILTADGVSPYGAAYACYLAGIPLRAGYSCEFGGAVLTDCFPPPAAGAEIRHLRLVELLGFEISERKTA